MSQISLAGKDGLNKTIRIQLSRAIQASQVETFPIKTIRITTIRVKENLGRAIPGKETQTSPIPARRTLIRVVNRMVSSRYSVCPRNGDGQTAEKAGLQR